MATTSAILWPRRIASCFFLTLAILSAALWVRSYQYADSVASCRRVNKTTTNCTVIALNGFGRARVRLTTSPVPYDYLRLRHDKITALRSSSYNRWFDWEVHRGRNGITFSMLFPHWFAVLTSSLLAIAIRPTPRFKFGLRDLFTLTTVVALTVGPLAFWLRSIS